MSWSLARTLESLPTAPGKACSMALATLSSSPASQVTGWRVRRGWSASEAGGGCGAPLCQGVLVGGHMLFNFLLSSPSRPLTLTPFLRPRSAAKLISSTTTTAAHSLILKLSVAVRPVEDKLFSLSLKSRCHPAHSSTHVWGIYWMSCQEQPSFELEF